MIRICPPRAPAAAGGPASGAAGGPHVSRQRCVANRLAIAARQTRSVPIACQFRLPPAEGPNRVAHPPVPCEPPAVCVSTPLCGDRCETRSDRYAPCRSLPRSHPPSPAAAGRGLAGPTPGGPRVSRQRCVAFAARKARSVPLARSLPPSPAAAGRGPAPGGPRVSCQRRTARLSAPPPPSLLDERNCLGISSARIAAELQRGAEVQLARGPLAFVCCAVTEVGGLTILTLTKSFNCSQRRVIVVNNSLILVFIAMISVAEEKQPSLMSPLH